MRFQGPLFRQCFLLSALLLGPQPVRCQARAAPPDNGHPVNWRQMLGEGVAVAAVYWGLSYFRFRRLRQNQRGLERRLADCVAELDSERIVLDSLRKLPMRDKTTFAWNNIAIMEILVREMLRAVRENSRLGVVIVEVDGLKKILDSRGGYAGDVVIHQTAERLISVLRAYDSVGHYRENEFLLVLPGWNPESAPQRVISLLDTIGLKPCEVDGAPLRVTSSLGVAAFDPRMDSPYPDELLRRADEALHMSKAAGPNHAVVAPR